MASGRHSAPAYTFWMFLVILTFACSRAAAWSPDAGVVQTLGGTSRTVWVTSNDAAKNSIIDGNDQVMWQSGACFPTGFMSRADMNILLKACTNSSQVVCSATPKSTALNRSFDDDVYTSGYITASNGGASLNLTLPQPMDLYRLVFKGGWGKGFAKVVLLSIDGSSSTVTDGGLNSTINYQHVAFKGLWPAVVQIQLFSNDTIMLTEAAAQYTRCYEQAIVDMQQVFNVQMVRARWWSVYAISTTLLASENGKVWTVLSRLVPDALPTQDMYFESFQARYLSIRHDVNETGDWMKVYVWEIAAYPAGGRYGLPPEPVPQARSYRQIAGVNGIWGWGEGAFSSDLVKQGKGPVAYNAVASHGRNYHNLNWDVKVPTNDPKYDNMSKSGTDALWWNDWDREYKGWWQGGLPVDATLQFSAKKQPPSSWGADPYTTSFTLGFKFAKHFGTTSGTANVAAFEVGNEPWDYNATFYQQLLAGFIDGLYAGDPAILRLPCAMQANDPLSESSTGGHYIGARVTESMAGKLGALNTHIYSYFTTENGTRITVQPEHPGSTMNALHNFIRWRDENMRQTPIWVTEWGFDASRPRETCNATECVSQLAQAAYGVRGLALLARKGVERATWFFYANDDECNWRYCRSGLRDSKSYGFAELPVYRAFKAFMQLAGSARFQSVVMETPDAHVHVLSNNTSGAPTHLLAWRPISVGESEGPADSITVTFTVSDAAVALQAWSLSGAAPSGAVAAALPAVSGQTWAMQLCGIPTLVVLSQ